MCLHREPNQAETCRKGDGLGPGLLGPGNVQARKEGASSTSPQSTHTNPNSTSAGPLGGAALRGPPGHAALPTTCHTHTNPPQLSPPCHSETDLITQDSRVGLGCRTASALGCTDLFAIAFPMALNAGALQMGNWRSRLQSPFLCSMQPPWRIPRGQGCVEGILAASASPDSQARSELPPTPPYPSLCRAGIRLTARMPGLVSEQAQLRAGCGAAELEDQFLCFSPPARTQARQGRILLRS